MIVAAATPRPTPNVTVSGLVGPEGLIGERRRPVNDDEARTVGDRLVIEDAAVAEAPRDGLEHRSDNHARDAVDHNQCDGKHKADRDVAVLVNVDRQQLGRHVECDEESQEGDVTLKARQIDRQDYGCRDELSAEEQPQRPDGLPLIVVTDSSTVPGAEIQ